MVQQGALLLKMLQSAHVSIGTVSRLLNNSGYVGKETAERIKKAIKDLEYIPNAGARSINNKHSAIIGVTVPQINNPFLADLVVQIESHLYEKNYSVMFCNAQYRAKKASEFIDDLIMYNADGLILVSTDINDEGLIKKVSNYLSAVSIGHAVSGFDSISLDDFESAYTMTKYLIDHNHYKIAFIGFNRNANQTMERVNGYKAAMLDMGLPLNQEYILESDAGRGDAYKLTSRLIKLDERPTAIIAINDFYAMDAYEAINDFGLKVGQDISVMGFDNISVAKFLYPSLTTVNCNTATMSKCAVQMLNERIKGEYTGKPRNIQLRTEIIYRNSVALLNRRKFG